MEKKEQKIKDNVVIGVSSTAGAAVGVVGASFVAQSLQANEVTDQENMHTHHANANHPHQPVRHHEDDSHQPEPPQPEPQPEPEVEVLSYETVTNDDGSQSDFAVVAVDGQPVVIADVDSDGIADVMAADVNHDGQIDEGEIVDISDEQMAMTPFQQETGMGGDDTYLADGDDYVNNANMNAYMA